MRGTWVVAFAVLVVAACTEDMPLTGGAAPSMTQVSSLMQGVRSDGELVPFPELQEVPEIAVSLMQQEYAERLDDRALVEAVRRTGGRVTIGLKPAGRGHTAETGLIPGMSRSEVLAAREEIRGRAIRLVRTFRTISDVVAEIDPEQAPAIRRPRSTGRSSRPTGADCPSRWTSGWCSAAPSRPHVSTSWRRRPRGSRASNT